MHDLLLVLVVVVVLVLDNNLFKAKSLKSQSMESGMQNLTFSMLSVMETRNMTNRPMHIKAVLFRLEPKTAMLKTSQELISKNLHLGIISHSDVETVGQELRKSGLVNEDDMDVIISRSEIIRHKSDADIINNAGQKMKFAINIILL